MKLLPKRQQSIFNNPTYEINFPLKHPEFIVPDYQYMDELDELMGNGHPFRQMYRKCVYFLKCIRYGKVNNILSSLKRKIKR